MGEEMYSNLTQGISNVSMLKLTSGTDCSGFFGYYPTLEAASAKEITNNIRSSFVNISYTTISKVIFHDPATIVIWADKSKTVVKCHNEPFDLEKGLAMCIAKKMLGEKFHQTFRDWCGDDE